jgi:hypothetical protein
MKRRFVRPIVTAGLLMLISSQGWAQCAMCVTALQNSAEGKVIAESFGNGILFLLAIPYVIFGTIAYTIYRAYKRKAQKSQ